VTLAAISRLRLALPDSDGVMRYVAPSTTAEVLPTDLCFRSVARR
jgi:hypothetical protein